MYYLRKFNGKFDHSKIEKRDLDHSIELLSDYYSTLRRVESIKVNANDTSVIQLDRYFNFNVIKIESSIYYVPFFYFDNMIDRVFVGSDEEIKKLKLMFKTQYENDILKIVNNETLEKVLFERHHNDRLYAIVNREIVDVNVYNIAFFEFMQQHTRDFSPTRCKELNYHLISELSKKTDKKEAMSKEIYDMLDNEEKIRYRLYDMINSEMNRPIFYTDFESNSIYRYDMDKSSVNLRVGKFIENDISRLFKLVNSTDDRDKSFFGTYIKL